MNEELMNASIEGRIDIVEKLLKEPSIKEEIKGSFGGELIKKIYFDIFKSMKQFKVEHSCGYDLEFNAYLCKVFPENVPSCPYKYHGSSEEEYKIFDQIYIILRFINEGAKTNTLNSHNEEKISEMIKVYNENDIIKIGWIFKKGKADDVDKEALKILEDNKENSSPKKLVKLLTNFTIDTPIKYTTHEWRKRIDEKYFDDFDLFLDDVSKQFNSMGDELNKLSPNLYEKIEKFICSKENQNSWKSMQNLKQWVEDKKEPFDFPLSANNMLFKEIIENFKNQIEIRGDNLQDIFLEHKKRLGREFKITISNNLKGEKFYTDVEKFKEAIDEIFKEIEKYAKEKDKYTIDIELHKPQKEFIELHIIHIGSVSGRSAEDLLERIKLEEGDSVLRPKLKNLCDWHIEASYKEESFSIDCFKEQTNKIEAPKGYTHIMRFYK